MNILILYATSMGNAESLANSLDDLLMAGGHACEVANVATIPPITLARESRPVVFCASTWGEGDPPDDAIEFWDLLQALPDDSLNALRFGVYALGDRNYEEFCGFGRKLDECLAARGATRLVDRMDNDTDYEEHLHPFSQSLLGVLARVSTPSLEMASAA